MREIHLIVRDFERASLQGTLTPTFIDDYAVKHKERTPALYKIAESHYLSIDHEKGRNDHILKPWSSNIDNAAINRAQDIQSKEILQRVRQLREDSRPSSLRRTSRLYPRLSPECSQE